MWVQMWVVGVGAVMSALWECCLGHSVECCLVPAREMLDARIQAWMPALST